MKQHDVAVSPPAFVWASDPDPCSRDMKVYLVNYFLVTDRRTDKGDA